MKSRPSPRHKLPFKTEMYPHSRPPPRLCYLVAVHFFQHYWTRPPSNNNKKNYIKKYHFGEFTDLNLDLLIILC